MSKRAAAGSLPGRTQAAEHGPLVPCAQRQAMRTAAGRCGGGRRDALHQTAPLRATPQQAPAAPPPPGPAGSAAAQGGGSSGRRVSAPLPPQLRPGATQYTGLPCSAPDSRPRQPCPPARQSVVALSAHSLQCAPGGVAGRSAGAGRAQRGAVHRRRAALVPRAGAARACKAALPCPEMPCRGAARGAPASASLPRPSQHPPAPPAAPASPVQIRDGPPALLQRILFRLHGMAAQGQGMRGTLRHARRHAGRTRAAQHGWGRACHAMPTRLHAARPQLVLPRHQAGQRVLL